MVMNRNEFIKVMNQHLRGIPEDEIADILYDFQEYFNAGVQDGRSEEELSLSLGDPKAIATQLKAEYMVKLAKSTPSFRNMWNAILAAMGLGFFKMLGLTLMTVGISLLLQQMEIYDFGWGQIWPLFVLGIGTAFEVSFFTNPMRSKANVSLLIPGGILTTIGLLFQVLVLTNYAYLIQLWPIFILSIAIGLFQFYFFGDKNVWILIPVVVLGSGGGIFLVKNLVNPRTFGYFLAVLFIAAGSYVWLNIGRKRF